MVQHAAIAKHNSKMAYKDQYQKERKHKKK